MTGASFASAERLPEGSIPDVEVTLRPGALIIADLHLAPGGDARTERFVDWCGAVDADATPQLIVMGDLFDMWVGARQARLAGSKEVLAALAGLAERGVEVLVIPGNRDALMGEAFERASMARLYADGFVGIWGDTRLAFVHGDSLCTLDVGYQRLRPVWRKGWIRFLSRHAPLWFAAAVGRRMRAKSEASKVRKLPEEKLIQPAALRTLSRATGAGTVVCGHAHDVRDDRMDDGVRFVVIGAWGWEGDLWRVDTHQGLICDVPA